MEDGSESPPMDQDTDQMSPMQDSGPLPVKQSAFDQLTSESTDESGVANGNNGNNQDDFQMGGMEGSHNPNQEGDDDAQEMQEEPAPSAPKDSGDTFGMLISNFQAVKKDKPPTPPPAEDDDDDEDSKDEPEKKKDLFDSVFDAKEEPKEKKNVFDSMNDSGDDANQDDNEGNELFGGDDETTADDKKDDDTAKTDQDDTSGAPATTVSEEALDETIKADEIITISSEKVPNDDKYYEDLVAEEKEHLEENQPAIDNVYGRMTCCTCGKAVTAIIGIKGGVLRHPHLGVAQCDPCRKFYGDGDWPRSEDGDEYCRFCGQGGDILLCDKCPNAFCKKCLNRNLGSKALREITKSEEWMCLLCDPKPLYPQKAMYYCAYKSQDQIKSMREADREKEKLKRQNSRNKGVSKSEKDAVVKNPQNFLEENISEAFKTLEVYQKALETERTRCIKTVKEGMSVDTATSITRKLRKLYAVTQKNMDLLDRAIVESFVENFPTESTRIHMGRMKPTDPASMTVNPTKPKPARSRSRKKPAKGKGKGKIKIKGKKKPTPKKAPAKKSSIKINGSATYAAYDDDDDVVRPSLKKRPAKSFDDSDVELVDSDDDDFYPRSKPGPASKKPKMGPKSKVY